MDVFLDLKLVDGTFIIALKYHEWIANGPHLPRSACLVAHLPLPPLEHVATDSTKSRSISFDPFRPRLLYYIRYREWAKGQAEADQR